MSTINNSKQKQKTQVWYKNYKVKQLKKKKKLHVVIIRLWFTLSLLSSYFCNLTMKLIANIWATASLREVRSEAAPAFSAFNVGFVSTWQTASPSLCCWQDRCTSDCWRDAARPPLTKHLVKTPHARRLSPPRAPCRHRQTNEIFRSHRFTYRVVCFTDASEAHWWSSYTKP